MRPAPGPRVLSTFIQRPSPAPPPASGEEEVSAAPAAGMLDSPTALPAPTVSQVQFDTQNLDSGLKVLTKKQKQLIDKALQLEDSEMETAPLNTIHYKTVTRRQRLDLIEVCTPAPPPLSETVTRRGGKAERFGLRNADLSNSSNVYGLESTQS